MEINLIAEVSQVSPPCYVSVKSGTAAPQRRARAYKGAQFARYTKFCMALADADVGDGENRNASTISSSGFWRRFKKSGQVGLLPGCDRRWCLPLPRESHAKLSTGYFRSRCSPETGCLHTLAFRTSPSIKQTGPFFLVVCRSRSDVLGRDTSWVVGAGKAEAASPKQARSGGDGVRGYRALRRSLPKRDRWQCRRRRHSPPVNFDPSNVVCVFDLATMLHHFTTHSRR